MEKPRRKFVQHRNGGRGAVLLLDDHPETRALRANKLIDCGFQVQPTSTIGEAKSLWQPDRYVIVLVCVRKNLGRAAAFCDRIKQDDPALPVGMVVPEGAKLPPTSCPDMLWPDEDLEYLIARVETLVAFAPAA